MDLGVILRAMYKSKSCRGGFISGPVEMSIEDQQCSLRLILRTSISYEAFWNLNIKTIWGEFLLDLCEIEVFLYKIT